MQQLKKYWLLILMHVLALLPLALLVWDFFQQQLTVNPIQEITHRTGYYALLLLVLSLVCTPLNAIFGLRQVVPLRRWLGLYAFLYASLHFLTYIGLDYAFDLDLIWQELAEKRYVVAGFAAFVLLIPLAITSTRGWMRRLGKNWKRLHRLVYLAAILAVVHFVWLVKSDITEPLLFGAAVALLLLLRVPAVRKKLIALRYRIAPPRRTGA
jgi:sulfoxide reductase heme-binding subunit YedZ